MFDTPVGFTITFGNGALQNLAGADFVIFELGIPDEISVTVSAITNSYLTVNTGLTAAGFNLNAISINHFGIANNAFVSTIEVNNASPVTGSASKDAIGALNTNTVPEPGTLVSFAGRFVLLFLFRRKQAA